jgi:dihydromonapterin reductase/dihydrofolate reductase
VFDDMFRIHTKLPYLLSRALAPLLTAARPQPADIIAISDFAVTTGSCNHMAYAASKAALENLVLSLARQLAPQVKVNAIAPALLMFNEGDSADYKAYTLKKSLMEIEPGPAEVLQSILYLLQSRYITGRVLALDGGRHLKLP